MQRLLDILRQLRAPGGCPWDREQTHESLRPYLLEEAAEAVDALGRGEPSEVVDELGDVLLHVAFHAVIAEETETYSYDDVETAIVTKLIRRHPHVFGDRHVSGAGEVVANWDAIKAQERRDAGRSVERGPADSVPRSLPALKRTAELDRALDWPIDERDAALSPSTVGTDRHAIARLLMAAAQVARRAGIDPEIALRDAANARAAADADR